MVVGGMKVHIGFMFYLITPSEYIEKYPLMQVATPCRSSWGANGYSEVWLNTTNDYVHRHLHVAGDRMVELANKFPNEKDKIKKAALNQCARELVLAQSSDWLFIITNGTMVDYELLDNKIDKEFLQDIEEKDCIFPDIDYMIYK